jgi:CBS domain containing-hemolysin-like protein
VSAGLVIGTIALLLGNGFFVGAEFAVISARRSSIELRADDGSRAAKTVLWAMENVPLVLACAQIGVTVCSVSLGVVTEPALAHALEPVVEAAHLPEAATHGLAVAIALLVISGFHVIVGEMVPKNAAVSSPDRAALILGPALVAATRAIKPIIVALNWMANVCIRALGADVRDEITSAFTADEVHRIVERSSEEGTLDDAHGLLTGAIEFSDRTAGDVMVPIAKLRTVSASATVADLERAVAETGFSRFPVCDGPRVIGYLHLKDVLYAQPSERDERVQGWRVRHLPGVQAGDSVESVLRRMSESGAHIAGVEHGGEMVGIMFLEDILEELVGEVGGRGGVASGG